VPAGLDAIVVGETLSGGHVVDLLSNVVKCRTFRSSSLGFYSYRLELSS